MKSARVERIRELLIERDLEALIVNGRANLRYLSGFTGTSGVALVAADGQPRFFTDFRYQEQSAVEVEGAFAREIVDDDPLIGVAAALPAVEVHLSKVDAREPWRRLSVVRDLCVACVSGHGVEGYREALVRLSKELDA